MKETVLAAIAEERARQDAQWGGPAHDDGHVLADWMMLIGAQLNKYKYGPRVLDRTTGRARLVKIAALAIAALESAERKGGL